MWDAIAWLTVFLLIGLAFRALIRERDQKRRRSALEFERDLAAREHSMLRAGLLGLDKFFGDERQKRAAIEYRMDEEGGMTRTGGKDDDRDRTSGRK